MLPPEKQKSNPRHPMKGVQGLPMVTEPKTKISRKEAQKTQEQEFPFVAFAPLRGCSGVAGLLPGVCSIIFIP